MRRSGTRSYLSVGEWRGIKFSQQARGVGSLADERADAFLAGEELADRPAAEVAGSTDDEDGGVSVITRFI